MRVLFVTHNVPRFEGDAAGSFVLRLAVALGLQRVGAVGDDEEPAQHQHHRGQIGLRRLENLDELAGIAAMSAVPKLPRCCAENSSQPGNG